jgi:hypothetical protein
MGAQHSLGPHLPSDGLRFGLLPFAMAALQGATITERTAAETYTVALAAVFCQYLVCRLAHPPSRSAAGTGGEGAGWGVAQNLCPAIF